MVKLRQTMLFLLAATLLMVTMLPAFANDLRDMRNEQEALRREIRQTESEIREYKRRETTLERELRSLERTIDVVQAEVRLLGRRVSVIEGEIGVAEEELAAAEASIAEMERLLAVRLRAIHENGQVSYLEVLFSSATFAEFLTRYNNLQLIIAEDRELLTRFQEERERFVALKENLGLRRQELQDLRRQNILREEELGKRTEQRERMLVAARNEIEEREDMIRRLEAENRKLDRMIEETLARQRSAGYRGTGQYDWPVDGFGPEWITSGFGNRVHPITRRPGQFHGGVDIGIPHNRWPGSRFFNGRPVNVLAADSGVAHVYRMAGGFGNLVIIDHGAGIVTVYAHNHSFLVADGENVQRGQPIATVGSTGFSTGPHLHFEIRINGQRVNPLPYIN
ncbi:MAG: Murein hydrolase activator EnvC [Syntrophomonadaceae bacterium]|nr:Murein hydrolase activator EnvC [Bacillota bacterium]